MQILTFAVWVEMLSSNILTNQQKNIPFFEKCRQQVNQKSEIDAIFSIPNQYLLKGFKRSVSTLDFWVADFTTCWQCNIQHPGISWQIAGLDLECVQFGRLAPANSFRWPVPVIVSVAAEIITFFLHLLNLFHLWPFTRAEKYPILHSALPSRTKGASNRMSYWEAFLRAATTSYGDVNRWNLHHTILPGSLHSTGLSKLSQPEMFKEASGRLISKVSLQSAAFGWTKLCHLGF